MRKQNDGRAALQVFNIFLQPFELLVTEAAQAARLQVHDIHQADEMSTVMVEAVPAIAHGTLSKTLAILLPVIVEHIMLAGNIKDAASLQPLKRLVESVEFCVFGELSKIAGVQHKSRRGGQGIDL